MRLDDTDSEPLLPTCLSCTSSALDRHVPDLRQDPLGQAQRDDSLGAFERRCLPHHSRSAILTVT